jgi:hypothetical protein
MYKEKIVNAETGEISWRDYTPEEVAEVENSQSEAAQLAAEETEKATQRALILQRLGLTEDEAKLILG